MKKRYLIMIIIAIVLVICLGAGLAFAYFATDLFKSNKQIFSKYFSKNSEVLELFNDSDLKSYAERQNQNAYTSEGSIKTNVTFPDSSQKQISDALQNCNITFNGKTDIANNYMYSNIKANYSQAQSLNIQLYRNNDIYAFKVDDVLAKFLGVENNNLKELASKFGLEQEQIANIPNQINLSEIQSLNIFTDDEISQLKDKYFKIVVDNLTDKMFSKEKNNEYSVYTLTVNYEQYKNISTKLLETLKNDDLIKNKIRELCHSKLGLSDEEINKLIESYEQSIQLEYEDLTTSTNPLNESSDSNASVDSSNSTETNSDEKVFIKVYTEKGKLAKTEFLTSDDNGKFVLVKTDNGARFEVYSNDTDTPVSYNASIQKIKTNNDLKYNLTVAKNNEQLFDLIVTYAGINTNQVHEISELNFEFDTDNSILDDIQIPNFNNSSTNTQTPSVNDTTTNAQTPNVNNVTTTSSKIKFVSTYNNTKSLGATFEKNDVKNEDIMLINSAPNAQSIQTAFAQISQQFVNVNNSKLASIGLNNNTNPFLFYIPSVVPVGATMIIPNYNNQYMLPASMLVGTGVSISMLTGDSVILSRASEAKQKTDTNTKNEINQLELTEIQTSIYSMKYVDNIKITKDNIQNYLKTNNIDTTVTENSDNTFTIVVKENNNTYVVNSEGKVISHTFAE